MGNKHILSEKRDPFITAPKSKSRKVWTSFGIAMCIYPLLSPQEVCN